MIAVIGATGAVLAGGAVAFVYLLGVVSFDVWPAASPEPEGPTAELRIAQPSAVAAPPDGPAAVSGPFAVVLPTAVLAPGAPAPGALAPAPAGFGGRDISGSEKPAAGPPIVVVVPPTGTGNGQGGEGTGVAGTDDPLPLAPEDGQGDAAADALGGDAVGVTETGVTETEEPLPQEPGADTDDPIVEPSPAPDGEQTETPLSYRPGESSGTAGDDGSGPECD